MKKTLLIYRVRKARALLIHDLSQHITIPDLAKKVKLNEHDLQVGFKNTYRHTIFQYLKRKRLLMAMDMLLNTKKPVQIIAHQCGYKNNSTLNHAFQYTFGCSPTEYRKEWCKPLIK